MCVCLAVAVSVSVAVCVCVCFVCVCVYCVCVPPAQPQSIRLAHLHTHTNTHTGESQKIARIVEHFAQHYYEQVYVSPQTPTKRVSAYSSMCPHTTICVSSLYSDTSADPAYILAHPYLLYVSSLHLAALRLLASSLSAARCFSSK